jgi:hypothetical protein
LSAARLMALIYDWCSMASTRAAVRAAATVRRLMDCAILAFAICKALGVTPGDVLTIEDVEGIYRPALRAAERTSSRYRAAPEGRAIIL